MKSINVGDLITGTVTGIEVYGIFLSFENGESGLVHISEISDDFVKDVNDYAKVGDVITVKVLSISDSNHYKLSLKAIESKNKKNKNNKIKETDSGFTNLKNKLDEWVSDFEAKI